MKLYRVKKENFLWEVGAILEFSDKLGTDGGYQPIDILFSKFENDEYISAVIIENSPEYFERVYEVQTIMGKMYCIKEKAKEFLIEKFKS